jgi:hypothetical protein
MIRIFVKNLRNEVDSTIVMAVSESPGVPLHEQEHMHPCISAGGSNVTTKSSILLDDEEIQQFAQANEAKNTMRKTR